MSNTVQFTAPMLKRFKKAFNTAKINNKEQFTFDGNEYLVSYAKYLIEYLDPRFNPVSRSTTQRT